MSENIDLKWYVIHTYSGYEKKVKAAIEQTIENLGIHDLIKKVVIPMEKVIEVKNGKEQKKEKKVFPGYVIIKMIVTDDTWYLVRNTKGVTGFVGTNSKPIALTDREVARMGLEEPETSKVEKKVMTLDAKVGDEVLIIADPFRDRKATITNINSEKGIVKAKILMLGRETDIELEFSSIKKIEY